MTIASHWVHDVPLRTETVELEISDDVDLTLFPAVEGVLLDPLGQDVSLTGATFTLNAEEREVVVSWGVPTRFEVAGLYRLQLTLVGFGAIRQRTAPALFVVEDDTAWHTLDSARREWADADMEDVQLYTLLTAAKEAVLAYAPATVGVPLRFKQAQLMQTRAVWNATKAGSEDSIGPEGFSVRVYPLDKNIRQLLRPKTVIPAMF